MDAPSFCPWTPWRNRGEIHLANGPGVYVLAQFEEAPPTIVDPIDSQVIYIGETCSQTLLSRWYQFKRSAFARSRGHSGGCNFSVRFMNDEKGDAPEWLFVSSYAPKIEEPRCSAYIRYLERKLMWDFVDKHGRLPICNAK